MPALTMDRTINSNLDSDTYDRAISRREHMRNTQLDPMMTTGAGTMAPDSPGSPGSKVEEYLPDTQYQTADVNKSLDLEKLQGLFEGHRAFAPEMRERQVKCMWKICKHYCEGLLIRDLPCTTAVITVAKTNVDKGLSDFKQPLVGVLRLLGQPLIKLASSDDLRSIHNLCDVVCAMGQCTECSDAEVVTEASKSLVTFSHVTRIHTLGEEAGETFLQSSFTQRIIERSQVIPILVAILRDSLENPEATSAITACLKSFSTFSSNARQIIASGASELLVTVLTNDFNVPAVHTAIEVLWNCLENEASAKTVLASWHTLNTLKELLERILVHGNAETHKETRSEVLVLLNLIASEKESHTHFVETGLIELILHLATAHELGWGDTFVAPFFQLTSDTDFEFKQLLFGVLGQLAASPEALKMILANDAMLTMVQHLDPAYADVSIWKPVQEEELLNQVLRILFTMAPKALTDFDNAGGFAVTLQLLRDAAEPGASEDCRSRCPQIIVLMMNIASEPEYRQAIGKCGFIPAFLELVAGKSTDALTTGIRQDALGTLSLLCQNCPDNQRLMRKAGGIPKVTPFLRYNARDPNKQEKVVLAAVDCIWNSVVSNPRCEAAFFAEGGVGELLALLEGCPLSAKAQVLGTLGDLMLNPKALSFMYEWRSETTAKNILQVLIECWGIEELRLGHSCPNGVITDMLRPLLGVEPEGGRPVGKKEKQGAPQRPSEVVPEDAPPVPSRSLPPPHVTEEMKANAAIPATAKGVKGAVMNAEDPSMITGGNDPLFIRIVQSDAKAKMYCILRRLDISQFDDLTPAEQVKLPLIKAYSEFKESEVWHDIERELDAEDITPVEPDETFLAAKVEELEAEAMRVQNVQKLLMKDFEEETKVDHEHFLESVAENMHRDIAQSIKKGRAAIMTKKGMGHKL